jgi:hypothetical protein
LFDIESGQTQNYLLADYILLGEGWSNDGRWLVSTAKGFLMLTAPEVGYDHLISHDFRDCTGVAWIK